MMLAFTLVFGINAMAQEVKLPAPDKKVSTTLFEALQNRKSVRDFTAKELTEAQLSNLLWATIGVNREDGRMVAPTAMNRQEIRLFAFTKDGVYEYNAKENTLVEKAKGDNRELMAGGGNKAPNGKKSFRQTFVLDAPVSLLMVIDFEKFGRYDEKAVQMGCVDAGNVSENINLYCQSAGLATVPRATHDTEGIRTLLGLTDKHLPIMNNPVGFEKK